LGIALIVAAAMAFMLRPAVATTSPGVNTKVTMAKT
jgi:hypothetical protein